MKFLLTTAIICFLFLLNLTNCIAQGTTTTINGVTYKAILYGDQSLSIKDGAKTIVHVKRADLYLTFERFAKMEFKDVNGDGYPDLVIDYHSNIPGRQDLVLYDKKDKKFAQVMNYPDYPASTRIPNSAFFYSYRTNGCADQDWDSDLYKIVNDKIIAVSTMEGHGCTNSGEPLGIFIYKKKGKKERPINKLPISELTKYNNDKSKFIANYWAANYAHL